MKFIKKSVRLAPKVSLILLDWSVRESFHLLHYLSKQEVDRDLFEVIIVEYYSRVSDAIRNFEDQVDSWLLLEMPDDCYYHKHLMYNAGIIAAIGDICVICDSDAMVKPTFIRSIIAEFEKHSNLVLHIDQFRNSRKDLYPFSYPEFSEVTGRGCINNQQGKTKGILDDDDPVHTRNYGACMCARREDLIAIGGADEHIDYLGHICGPYEMTFRLINYGRIESWHQSEFMYHTWHPGQAGVNNYLAPHDGRHIAAAAIESLTERKVYPKVENKFIRELRVSEERIHTWNSDYEIACGCPEGWKVSKQSMKVDKNRTANVPRSWCGYIIERDVEDYQAYPLIENSNIFSGRQRLNVISADSYCDLQREIIKSLPFAMKGMLPVACVLILIARGFGFLFGRAYGKLSSVL